MPVTYITVKHHTGQRLDNFLLREMKDVPKARIYRMIRRGEVRINGRRCQVSSRLSVGDSVRIPPYTPGSTRDVSVVPDWLAQVARDSIIHEDDDIIVVNKPSGVAVHGGSKVVHGMVEAIRAVSKNDVLDLVHRIDKDTSGCLLFAKSRDALLRLHKAFRHGDISKRYVAIAEGCITAENFVINDRLLRYSLPNGERRVKVDPQGQSAQTQISVIEKCSVATYLDVQPTTGRTHQIRVHLSHRGHSVLGDRKYGNRDRQTPKAPRLMLHAAELELSGWFRVEAPIPALYKNIWSELSSADRNLRFEVQPPI